MQKKKQYDWVRFPPEVIRKADSRLHDIVHKESPDAEFKYDLSVNLYDETWDHDSLEEFFSDYRKSSDSTSFRSRAYIHEGGMCGFSLYVLHQVMLGEAAYTDVTVSARTREDINKVFDVFEESIESSRIPKQKPSIEKPTIFIGHGHSQSWRDLKDHLADQHGYEIEAYETGARAGHAIRDILGDMAGKSNLAFLVLTGDCHPEGKTSRARQNVVHETGLFQGRLGFSRAVVLVEEGIEGFSNLDGIQQIRFSKDNIREAFGDVLATIKREFPNR